MKKYVKLVISKNL